ncbi:TetR/AcrR family transcriptional regulator [Streptomyces acidiscabies]|uniref:TetR/AcrR family transcriptional regulator n=1 Tax=Streptomyces acidiscabies TaxID=42234 RepID=A0AAP6BHI5_9ACTN|nr:TetR/AcrR family transcriptional regulator [Streptomyces acidiscabies]MBP5934932.1 TetR/AcrR family transcriptional regulator [Streptomyces sp. LBUM 1476]MBZ3917299.1 TetR/AcrR family transcriptional regulator [Streptomyces acidiscabies]MDX2964824.1 TetR/AcrR family transcriptional regulator [Streptomyces acidiscabies]MDX3023325.1 TetR/AcrR family transcriptional regulator [Streptomyces acidiscabies]MDX3795872.1 TetR/AcrR family transcriptional regulator [Streptomyces acidiscabies]
MTDTLTEKGRATRKRIVAGATEVLRELGVAHATLDDIRGRTGTSKSQLFHYFPDGKDELLLAVARFEAEQVLEDQQPFLGRLNSWEAWAQLRDVVVERYERLGDHCPLGALFLQVGRDRPGARAVVVELMRRWQEHLAQGVRELQAAGLVSPALDVERTSASLLAGIQGGVMIMMSTGDSVHLKAALDTGIDHLRAASPNSPARNPS